ncbi:HAD family hydrolase [Oceanispirochaeta sp.]|jgi:phosphoglycolate phosphatase|uniref:HAD family hydrolase n=1 Tax=Oceanispirochaeta sp. TaxID=2035350 RepID=UPI002603BC34|nr:HAD family hydrolase [Oceanispirochaeta sp.]MDA3957323.1 HAD family hydrolase [Oceanispirochaeta sp.]
MNKVSFKAVIFDLDGTLVDSMKDIASAVNRVLIDYNLPPQEVESFRSRVGWGLAKTLEMTMHNLDTEEMNKATSRLVEYYRADPCSQTEVYEGILTLLKLLKDKGLSLFVYTNKDQITANFIIDAVFPGGTFEAVFGARPGLSLKPDARSAAEIIRQSGFSSDEILYVGDSDVDMETAMSGNMKALAVLWGYRSRKQLNKYKKLAYVERADEIGCWII